MPPVLTVLPSACLNVNMTRTVQATTALGFLGGDASSLAQQPFSKHPLSPFPGCSLMPPGSPSENVCLSALMAPAPSEEQSTHRELVIHPHHVRLLFAGQVPAEVAHDEERGRQADGRACQDAAPKGGVKHLLADHQGQSQEQSVCSADERAQDVRLHPSARRRALLRQPRPILASLETPPSSPSPISLSLPTGQSLKLN